MAKSEILSTAPEPKDLDKAYASANKAISLLGIKMASKKPDVAKLGPIMTKNKTKAEFKLGGDAKLLKFTVECDGAVNTLGLVDLKAEKSEEKRIAVLKSLEAAGLITKAELLAAMPEKGPDPKVVANQKRKLEKEIAELKAVIAKYDKCITYDDVSKSSELLKELEAFAKSEMSLENITFLKAVAARMNRTKLLDTYIKEGAKEQINIPAASRVGIESGKLDMTVAVNDIKKLIKADTLPRFRIAKRKQPALELQKLEAELAKLK